MNFDYFAQEVAAATTQSQLQGTLIGLKVAITSAAMQRKKEAIYSTINELPDDLIHSLEDYGIEFVGSIAQDDDTIDYHFNITKVGC